MGWCDAHRRRTTQHRRRRHDHLPRAPTECINWHWTAAIQRCKPHVGQYACARARRCNCRRDEHVHTGSGHGCRERNQSGSSHTARCAKQQDRQRPDGGVRARQWYQRDHHRRHCIQRRRQHLSRDAHRHGGGHGSGRDGDRRRHSAHANPLADCDCAGGRRHHVDGERCQHIRNLALHLRRELHR